jgi:hypothetical protein
MYTILAPGGALLPEENCTMRREVGMKRETVTSLVPSVRGVAGSLSLSAATCG